MVVPHDAWSRLKPDSVGRYTIILRDDRPSTPDLPWPARYAIWSVRYFIVDTRNWWFGQHVLISPLGVKTIDWFDRHVELNVSREQVKASPPWDPLTAFNDDYAKRLHRHYGWLGSSA
jgi:hypothetical protein